MGCLEVVRRPSHAISTACHLFSMSRWCNTFHRPWAPLPFLLCSTVPRIGPSPPLCTTVASSASAAPAAGDGQDHHWLRVSGARSALIESAAPALGAAPFDSTLVQVEGAGAQQWKVRGANSARPPPRSWLRRQAAGAFFRACFRTSSSLTALTRAQCPNEYHRRRSTHTTGDARIAKQRCNERGRRRRCVVLRRSA